MNLENKKQKFGVEGIGYWYSEDNLKKAIQKLKDGRLNCYECGMSVTDELLIEIFGKELVEAKEE